ncbi:MAG: hypothetical protein LUJ09_06500 [Firmicutes bacterium]|nr:hypothetical protein [Bacillota bacterium]
MDMVRWVLAVGLTIVLAIPFYTLVLPKNKGQEMVRKAKSDGTVVTADLVNAVLLMGTPGDLHRSQKDTRWKCTYTYEVDGIQRNYTFIFVRDYPRQLELYYPKGQPQRAICSAQAQQRPGCAYMLMTVAPVIFAAVIYGVLGLIMD